jgi:alanine racemase
VTIPPCGTGDAAAHAVLDIDLAAVADNWRRLRAAHGGRPTAAVLKADAYGHGARHVAPYLHAAGCRHFFTAHLAEALAIRPLLPDAMLAVLNGLLPGTEETYLAHDIDPVLGSLAEIERWAALAHRTGRRLPALLHVDTGMARLGLEEAELRVLAREPARLAGIEPRYVMTHLVSAELPEDSLNQEQLRRFEAACAQLPPAPRSLANSAGLFLGPAFASDLARAGAALYGINPTPWQANPMRPTVRLRGRVLQLRHVAAGDGVGYNATWRAARPSRIAVLSVGYADGWPRALSNRGRACFDGVTVPLVGRVSMDLTTYDVTDLPAVGPGDWLELIGPRCDVEQVAEAAGTNAYEIFTSLGRRYARVWHE